MSTNLVRMCPCLRVGKRIFNGQQPCHFMHIESGIDPFLPSLEIQAREDLNSGDVWEGLHIGRKNMNWLCISSGWDYDPWREICSGKSYTRRSCYSFDNRGRDCSIGFHNQIPKIVKAAACRRSETNEDSSSCKIQENSNFLKNGKMVILLKIRNFSRYRMTKRTSPLESSREI